METEPYSIYVNHRPFQIAFLVDQNQDNGWLEMIMEYNRDRWGGRFNPIIFTDGKEISDDWWEFLKDYDPDIIYSTVVLSEELKKKIHIFLTPLRIQEADQKPEYKHIYLDDYPISILPTGRNVSLVAGNLFDDKSKLVFFEIDDTTPDVIKSFLNYNFGLIEPGQQIMSYQMNKALETCELQKYKITDLASLNEALLDMSNFHRNIVFPAQICALPNTYKETKDSYNHEKFMVIIGDTLNEKTYFWNRTFNMGAWLRTKYTQMWLPIELANDTVIRTGLEKFLNKFTGSTGNNNNHGLTFVSFSIAEKELNDIASSFHGKVWHPVTHLLLNKHDFPNYRHSPFFYIRKNLDFHRAHSQTEHLTFSEPEVEHSLMGGERWFVDLYIQFRPERFKNISGVDYWWQLPKRNSLVRDLQIFNQPARINEHGSFSVMMSRRTSIHPEDNTLVIKLPDDRNIFSSLICGESFECINKEQGARYDSRPFYYVNRSDKGMYLAGVIGLFSGLSSAHGFFEERYWRNVFEKMANHNQGKDEKSKNDLLNTLRKKIVSGMDLKQEEAQEWLAKNVVNIAKNYSKEEIDLGFPDLIDMAQKETDEYNTTPSGDIIPFDKKGLKERVSDLIESGIFLLGLKPKCSRCGYRIWYQVDDIKQKILCRGCGYEFALPAEQPWSYRLNNLVRGTISLHGTVPLLLTLGQIKQDARSSFMFVPSIELFKKGEEGKREIANSEIDLVCIIDGKFTIGEIKQDVKLFSQNDFTKIKECAKLIRPDKIIFSSMNKEPSKFVIENIKKLQEELLYLGITVQWYPIHYWVFQPHPVR